MKMLNESPFKNLSQNL